MIYEIRTEDGSEVDAFISKCEMFGVYTDLAMWGMPAICGHVVSRMKYQADDGSIFVEYTIETLPGVDDPPFEVFARK